MEYTARSIQQLLQDVKPYIKPAAITPKAWVLLVDENGKEYKDTHYYMTDKFGLYRLPVGVNKFRAGFEADLNKQMLGGLRSKPKGVQEIKFERFKSYFPKDMDEYEVATSFTLDFDSSWGLVCHAKADSGLSKKINLSILFPFEEIAKEFPDYSTYELYLKEGHSVVPVWAEELIGFVTPIYADKEGNNKE